MATGAKLVGQTAAGAMAGVALIGLDPIVFGGVRHPTAPAVQWAVLAQWNWE